MKCPVCETNYDDNLEKCPVCGWEDYEALDKITMENRLREIEEAKKRVRGIDAKNQKQTEGKKSPLRRIISIVSALLLISLLGFGACMVLSGILQGFMLLFQ